ncbi:MAG: hypothetical protein HRU19_27695 [Pseudobacteriovorax sp.]|nr:hypothetical protein [Pseudobacteriovorax sp.]
MYLYHLKPKNLEGSILYPLNQIKERFPEAYHDHYKKYQNRADLPKIQVPKTGLTWSDFLHFSPYDFRALKAAAMSGLRDYAEHFAAFDRDYFRVDSHDLEADKLFIFFNRKKKGSTNDHNIAAEEIAPFSEYKGELPTEISEEQIDDYRLAIESGRGPLLFSRSVHVLYAGSVCVENTVVFSTGTGGG